MAGAKLHERFIGPFGEVVERYEDARYEGIECPHYDPCPICYRCSIKNLKYDWCKRCKVKTCNHTTRGKNTMIRKADV